ncbi:MAG: ChbG/HpnK family deacetylase [Elusimicrobiota bacterium]|jgi:hypothetical protein
MKKLVINADDFGRSSPVNQGIIEAHQKGIVTSASLMTNREGFAEAVNLAKANPKLGIGLHLDLDHFFNLQHGAGRLLGYRDPTLPMASIVQETEAQIQKALATGLPIGHLDGHHHVHLRPELFASVAALTVKYKIPTIRYFKGFYEGLYPQSDMNWILEIVQRFQLRCTDMFFAGWEPVESSLPGYRYFDPSASFQTAELMVHPGKGEAWREQELARCISSDIRKRLQFAGIEWMSFNELS